jgi:glycerol-3-phosphate dehydrogenase (NAD(P)+)
MKAAIIGSGNMGTALACLLAENGWKVTCWDHVPQVVDDIRKNHRNERFLPGINLHPSIQGEMLLDRAVRESSLVVTAVPSPYFRHVLVECAPFLKPDTIVVNAAKGLEPQTSKRLSKVFKDVATQSGHRFVVLAGPAVAMEFARKRHTSVVLASESEAALQKTAHALGTTYFRAETTSDVIGVECGSVLKNVYAIGLGLLDGLGVGSANLKGAFTAASLKEMKRLVKALGANPDTLDGPAGIGDLVATGFSPDSHNRRLGEAIGKGGDFEEAVDQLGGCIPEGVRSASRAVELGAQNGIDVTLAAAVEACLKNPGHARPKFLTHIWKVC